MTETTIDMTPTWAEILPALIAVMQDGTASGQENARHELRRMARAADIAAAMQRETPVDDLPEGVSAGEY